MGNAGVGLAARLNAGADEIRRLGNNERQVTMRRIGMDEAYKMVEHYPYAGQRPLDVAWVEHLAAEMRAGTFTLNTIELVHVGDDILLINGQHTLRAIFQAEVVLELPVVHIWVDSMDEVALLYVTADVGKTRGVVEGFKPYNLEEKLSLTPPRLRSLYAAVKLIGNNFIVRYDRQGVWQLKDAMAEWQPEMQQYIALTAETPMGRRMLSRHLTALGLVTLRYASHWPAGYAMAEQEAAAPFWQQVASDDGLQIGDPRKTLNRFIAESALKGGRNASGGISLGYAIRAAVTSWNKWWNQEPLKMIRIPNETAEFHIAGTPYPI